MFSVILIAIALLAHPSHTQEEEVKRGGAELVRMLLSALGGGRSPIPFRPVRRIGSEFLGKRSPPAVHFAPPHGIHIRPPKRRPLEDFFWKRRMGSEFLGKRGTLLQQLHAKRRMGNEFLGKRAMGNEFLGKRRMGNEFLGKRAMGNEFLGKRAMGNEFLGKRAMGNEFLGKRGEEVEERPCSSSSEI